MQKLKESIGIGQLQKILGSDTAHNSCPGEQVISKKDLRILQRLLYAVLKHKDRQG